VFSYNFLIVKVINHEDEWIMVKGKNGWQRGGDPAKWRTKVNIGRKDNATKMGRT